MPIQEMATEMSTNRPRRKLFKRTLWKRMEANTTLLESSAFRWTIRVFGYTSLLYAAIVVLNLEAHNTEPLSPEHLNNVVVALKNPALIAGVSLPLLGLIASHLRSIQTKKQIETQQDQNIFSNYLAHRSQFNEFMEEEAPLVNVSRISKWTMYGRLFPKAEEGDFEINSTLASFFETLPKRLTKLTKILESTTYNRKENWNDLETIFDDLESDFREFSQAVFTDDLDKELFLSKLERRIDKHLICVHALHECSNFHRALLDENSVWEIQEKYVQCKSILKPQSLRERILHELRAAALSPRTSLTEDREREQALKGKLFFENLCMGGDDSDIVIAKEISEVIDQNFNSEEKLEVERVLPAAINIHLTVLNNEGQESQP
ncbi:hypothetical protein ABWH88_15660 [Marinobacter adhaerens]|uniref:Uncharacterized protein n=1 Tax=Marinobacter adhaerens (strain DSM 23420 / HP15) TaxID=225937 RepID=E4PPI5_MARAH|nr:hypothetical protein [Marinobacter adhaerens]ADP98856.1 conserved hypothetical protein [Marinobacter adhaerens HP15]MBW4976637.1 hypothetical protein [Marinobacter adhaerens]